MIIYRLKFFYFLLLGFIIYSCNSKKDETKVEDIAIIKNNSKVDSVKLDSLPTKSQQGRSFIYKNWLKYYEFRDPNFSDQNFTKEEDYVLSIQPTNSIGIWDSAYRKEYFPFLEFSPDSAKYIDIHSYAWEKHPSGKIIYNADQEVILGDIPNKKAYRLLYYGPSYWVEDAYFKNDSVVVLMENSSENIPAYQEVNIRNGKAQYYVYNSALNFKSNYLQDRITPKETTSY